MSASEELGMKRIRRAMCEVLSKDCTYTSYGIPKVYIALKHLLSTIRFLVLSSEMYRVDHNNNSNKNVARQYTVNARVVGWLVLRAEDKGASNATDASESDHCGGAEGTLPVATDVVGLVGHACWNAALG